MPQVELRSERVEATAGDAALVHVSLREAELGRHEAGGEQRGAVAVPDDAPGGGQRRGVRRRALGPHQICRDSHDAFSWEFGYFMDNLSLSQRFSRLYQRFPTFIFRHVFGSSILGIFGIFPGIIGRMLGNSELEL